MKTKITQILKKMLHFFGRKYCRLICKLEFLSRRLKINERAVEYKFVFQSLAKIYPKTVLDIGTGTSALPQLMSNCGFMVTAIDNIRDYWPHGMFNRHYYVLNDDILSPKSQEKFNCITCVSVLEHINDHAKAVKNMLNLLESGGYLILTFPYNENKYVANAYKIDGSQKQKNVPYVCQVFSRRQISEWIGSDTIVEQEYWHFYSGELWGVGEKLCPSRQVGKNEQHDLTCLLIKKN